MISENELRSFCEDVYARTYDFHLSTPAYVGKKKISDEELKKEAQKEAIKEATLQGMKKFPGTDVAKIWKTVYQIHVFRKSGIYDASVIDNVISANQSWLKSSGHAFEEIVKFLGDLALGKHGISIVLQRDLNVLIKAGEIANEPRDISWLKEQIKGQIFDLYAIAEKDGRKYCYGCIQSKTSIRDRVTRDREPSVHAMQSFFWSVAVVLNGDFLKNGKFRAMVNGGTKEFDINGWHGLYVFSEENVGDRIFATDFDLKNFCAHAKVAAEYWLTQRQWFDHAWRPDFSGAE